MADMAAGGVPAKTRVLLQTRNAATRAYLRVASLCRLLSGFAMADRVAESLFSFFRLEPSGPSLTCRSVSGGLVPREVLRGVFHL